MYQYRISISRTMIKKVLTLSFALLIGFAVPLLAQTGSISLQVIAVKGTVKYQSKVLKKDDVITVNDPKTLNAVLNYSTAADWVNFINKKDKKILNFYAKNKTTSDGRYMFSRGTNDVEIPPSWQISGKKVLKGEKDVLSYFSRSSIFLFGNDTLVCEDLKVYEIGTESGFMVEFTVDKDTLDIMLGRNGILYITPQQIFETATAMMGKKCTSYEAGSMRLVYYGAQKQRKNYLEVDEFNIYFFEDIVRGLRELGMDDKNICEEIIYVFSSPEQVKAVSGQDDEKHMHSWLLKRIKKIR
jgi:hypothetical protein